MKKARHGNIELITMKRAYGFELANPPLYNFLTILQAGEKLAICPFCHREVNDKNLQGEHVTTGQTARQDLISAKLMDV